VFDIKKFAVDDGPGIRTTIFLKGCLLRCWWCHNPEGQLCTPELMFRHNRCNSCEECVNVCPRHAISLSKAKRLVINRRDCNLCGKCVQKCPTEALSIAGKLMSVNEVMKEIDKDRSFYEESKGGVTVSGGEPLLQINFLNTLLTQCKDRGIHTAVDTSGYASSQTIEKIKNETDLFLYDIKTMDDKKHKKYTGVSNKRILQNFRTLAENGSNLLVRFPVILRINDDENNIAKTAEFILVNGVEHVCLLPYHRAGIEKYRSLSRHYKLMKTPTASEEKLNSIKHQLEAFGLDVKIGGG
jgi:pyruvate formate lyase activating enzyme